jgi:hypothetical protein
LQGRVDRRSIPAMRRLLVLAALAASPPAAAFQFTEASAARGAAVSHGFPFGFRHGPEMMAGGAAGGDIDGDGDIDLILLRGAQLGGGQQLRPPTVLRNDGNAQFVDVTADSGLSAAHLNPETQVHNGAYLYDLDGDADLDLLLGALLAPPEIWRNDGGGHFVRDLDSGLEAIGRDTWGASVGSFWPLAEDELAIVMSHWTMDMSQVSGVRGHFLHLDGNGDYVDFSSAACCAEMATTRDHSFTASLVDFTGDGSTDAFWARDFGTSTMLFGVGDGGFSQLPEGADEPSDENGMGTAAGDFDNDGRLEWFVTSVFDPTPTTPEDPDGNWGHSGNRLYRFDADSAGWIDVSAAAGVRDGGWGWGACARDFDLDGDLDLFHVNGFFGAQAAEFHADAARLFLNDGAMHFSEQAGTRGIADTGQGRAVVCADLDRDGDIDVLVQNSGSEQFGTSKLYLNDAADSARGTSIRLRQPGMNREAINARVVARRSDGLVQMREIEGGGSFLGSHPAEAHFGWADARMTGLRVRWPDGAIEHFRPADAPMRTLVRGEGFDLFIDAFE